MYVLHLEQVALEEEQFRAETVKALTLQKLGIVSFIYSAVKRGNILELTWKKHIFTTT